MSDLGHCTLDIGTFLNVLGNTAAFASPDAARPVLNGVRFILTEQELTAVAADSYALVRQKVDLREQDFDGEFEVTVPLSDIKLIAAAAKAIRKGNKTAEVIFGVREGTVTITIDPKNEAARFVATAVPGDYIKYDQLWPADAVPMAKVRLSPHVLGMVGKLVDPEPVGGAGGAVFTFAGEHESGHPKPSSFAVGDTIDGILMPLRNDA